MITFQILVIALPLGLLVYSTFMLKDGNYSLSNLTLQHWIGERGTIYNHGEPGVLRNPKIYTNRLELDQVIPVYRIFYGVPGHYPRLRHRQRPGHPAFQTG